MLMRGYKGLMWWGLEIKSKGLERRVEMVVVEAAKRGGGQRWYGGQSY